MVRQFDIRSLRFYPQVILRNSNTSSPAIEKAVAAIIRRIQLHGDSAIRFYTKKFDGAVLTSLAVPEREIRKALSNADPEFVHLLVEAAKKIRRFHSRQRRASWRVKEKFGSDLRQRYLPVERVGVYVPGGKAAYPSTVLMNIIPAQVAGVKKIALVSPPDKKGNVHRDVLTAAAILGIKRVFRVGGAQAVAALAYGTKTIPAVDVIVGPGNVFVATAKKMLFGKVGIDSIAGPSEIVILADDSARPDFIASDMAAQAEHDEFASSILVTTSPRLAEEVKRELKKLITILPRKSIIATSLKNHGAIFLVNVYLEGRVSLRQLGIRERDLLRINGVPISIVAEHGRVAVGVNLQVQTWNSSADTSLSCCCAIAMMSSSQ